MAGARLRTKVGCINTKVKHRNALRFAIELAFIVRFSIEFGEVKHREDIEKIDSVDNHVHNLLTSCLQHVYKIV